MHSPTITNILETLSNPTRRFKTLSGFEILRDENNLPRYTVRSRTLDAAVCWEGKHWIICCPLHHDEVFDLKGYAEQRYKPAGPERKMLPLFAEMLVFNNRNESSWQDVLLVESSPDTFAVTGGETREYKDPLLFSEGLAVFENEGKTGFCDPEGNAVIPPRYDWADTFDEGLAVVKQGDAFGVIDKQGREILAPVYEDIRWRSDNGVIITAREGTWEIRDRQGEILSGNTFDFMADFSCGLALVRRENKYGYADRSGEIVIPLLYEEGYSFSPEGLATVVKNGITFCIDTDGMVFD